MLSTSELQIKTIIREAQQNYDTSSLKIAGSQASETVLDDIKK